MKKYGWILVGILALVMGAAPAQGAGLNDYFVGKLGSYSPESDDLNGYDTGITAEIGWGHYFSPFMALEFGVGYFQTEGNVIVIDSGSYYGNEEIEVTPLTMSLKLIQPLDGWMEIYGIGGIGVYLVNDSIDAFSPALGSIHISDDTAAFGAHLGAGIQFNISSNVFVGGEFKYVWTTADLYGEDVSLDGFRVTGNLGFRF
jgi:opacity protein-like surface antigen